MIVRTSNGFDLQWGWVEDNLKFEVEKTALRATWGFYGIFGNSVPLLSRGGSPLPVGRFAFTFAASVHNLSEIA
jgi:hypothetical protein